MKKLILVVSLLLLFSFGGAYVYGGNENTHHINEHRREHKKKPNYHIPVPPIEIPPVATPEAIIELPIVTIESHDPGPSSNTTQTPRCSDGETIQLPANVHVVRHGDGAHVNFFITEGYSANIYYKEVGQNGWTHSVLRDEVVKYKNGDNYVSYPIGGLNPNTGYIFGVEQVKGCGGGKTVTAVVIDGPTNVTFPLSYWEWTR